MIYTDIILSSLCFLSYLSLLTSAALNSEHKLFLNGEACKKITELNKLHLSGIIIFLVPIFFLDTDSLLLLHLKKDLILVKSIVLLLLGVSAGFVASHQVIKAKLTFVSTTERNSRKSLETYLIIRIVFIVVYELFFRGILLAVCLHYTSLVTALGINALFYTMAHAYAEKKEIIACPFFATVLCLLTLWYNTFIPAAFIHVVLCFTYDNGILKMLQNKPKQIVYE